MISPRLISSNMVKIIALFMSKVNKRASMDALSEITIWWNFTIPLEPILVQNAKNCEPRRLPQTVDAGFSRHSRRATCPCTASYAIRTDQ